MKKMILIFTALLVFLLQSNVLASDVYQDALFDISSFGIFIPDENGNFNTDKPLTRAEFATALLRLTGYADMMEFETKTSYRDVPNDAWYHTSVETVTALNLMTGDGNGNFRPDAYVSLEEATKTTISALGYTVEAQNRGGYPTGYMATATRIGLLDGLKVNGQFLRGDLAVLFYNALDIELLVLDYTSDEFFKDIETYRSILTQIHGERLYNGIGIVKATSFSYTEFPIDDLRENEVVINSVRYEIGSTNVNEYLGMEVEIFAREMENGAFRIVGVRPTNRNEVTTISFADITGATNSYVTYSTEGNKSKKAIFRDVPIMLYNGTPISFDKNELLGNKSGDVTLIDCDGNKVVDYIFVNVYESFLVQRVSGKVIVPHNGFTVNGKTTFFADIENEDKKYEFFDAEGNQIDFSSIEPEQLVSIFTDKSETRFRVYIGGDKKEGVLTSISDDIICLEDEEFEITDDTVFDAQLGDKVSLYLDYKGFVAYIKYLEGEKLYGYIIDTEMSFSNSQIRLLTGKAARFTADINSEDKDNVISQPVLICENDELVTLSLAEKVKINGQKYSRKEAVEYLDGKGAVLYEINGVGELSKVQILSSYAGPDYGTNKKLKYSIYERTFGGDVYIDGFAVDEKTQIICLPEQPDCEDDYFVLSRIDKSGSDKTGYHVQAYEMNEQTRRAELVVVTLGMDSDTVRSATISSSSPCMVKRVVTVCNDEEDFYRITLLEGGVEVIYDTIPLKNGNQEISNLRKGDLITYYKNDSNLIENVMILHSFNGDENHYQVQDTKKGFTEICGTVQEVLFDRIHNLQNYMTTQVVLDINGASVSLYPSQRNKPPVYMYDASNEELILQSSLEEVIPGYDKVYFLTTQISSPPKICVIIRN